jgi:alpha-ribazole phosphatase
MAGLAQCRERVRGLTVGRVIASDLSRAAMAAQAIAQDFGAELSLDPRWRNGFGAWDGADPEDLGAAVQRFWDDPVGNPPPGGESWGVLRERVAIALARSTMMHWSSPMRAQLGRRFDPAGAGLSTKLGVPSALCLAHQPARVG